jgi:hypothetical protein
MSTTATPETTQIFADVDRMDERAFVSHLAEDCVLRFGNAEAVRGRDAIEQVMTGFLTAIKDLSHEVVHEYRADDTTILELLVTYTRRDDAQVTVPAVTVYRRGDEGIDRYRVYLDLAPVYTEDGQPRRAGDETR